ncbi:MAG: sulfur carrier protein ThiS [Pseudomonadota bacterium]
MQIVINGEPREIAPGLTLAKFVETLPGDPRGIAIERNLEIVPKSEHGAVVLEDGDKLEVVRFVGGG